MFLCLTKAHAFAKTKPGAVEVEACVLDEQLEKKLETVQLYNNAVKRHMQDLSADT
jgi:hypothetical protein